MKLNQINIADSDESVSETSSNDSSWRKVNLNDSDKDSDTISQKSRKFKKNPIADSKQAKKDGVVSAAKVTMKDKTQSPSSGIPGIRISNLDSNLQKK